MKVKEIILFALLLIYPIICNSQIKGSLIIKKDSICIGVDSSKVLYSLLYEIENKSSNTYYLWIEKDIHSSPIEKIRDYFMKNKGDMSLYQMAMEINIEYGGSTIYLTFIKEIKPLETFSIQIISTEELSECRERKIFKYLDDHLVIMRKDTLKQYIAGLDNFNPLIFYKYNFITIPAYLFEF